MHPRGTRTPPNDCCRATEYVLRLVVVDRAWSAGVRLPKTLVMVASTWTKALPTTP